MLFFCNNSILLYENSISSCNINCTSMQNCEAHFATSGRFGLGHAWAFSHLPNEAKIVFNNCIHNIESNYCNNCSASAPHCYMLNA